MAVSGFGLSGVRMKRLDCGSTTPKLIALRPWHGLRTSKTFRFHGLAVSGGSDKPLVVCGSLVSEAIPKNAEVEDNSKNYISSDDALLVTEMTTTTTKLQDTEATTTTMPIPNADEVESFLMMLCDTTSIAEVELKCGGFRLYVARNLADQNAPPQLPAPDASQSIVETPDSNGSAVSTSLALSKPIPSSSGVEALLDKASDEGLAILKTPRVGYFRRSRTIKGKRTPPSCKEKDIVKEGQVLCYIDQLGGEIPIESDVSGEVVKILRDDGDPVGYGDALIAVLPSFPGIKHIQ